MKFLGIIPARFASTRFPGKPLADLGGKPLIQWVYENARKEIQNLIVATDHKDIYKAVKDFGGRSLMTSPDHPSGTDRCFEVARVLADAGERYDVILNIQGDEPFVNPQDLQLLKGLFEDGNIEIATLATPLKDSEDLFDPNIVKMVCDANGTALYFSRQALPYQRNAAKDDWISEYGYLKHLGIYAYRYDTLAKISKLEPSSLEKAESLEQLRWLESGFRIRAGIVYQNSIGIDTPEDLELARNMLGT
jgi:3-deoxy-manno-octulosonate cytidylyltransferase (CMP-KDO synthetase)